ncbi:MAG: antirestriction protein [Ilumatobacteraceae bacterium]|nr:antirestriction protein [Ilumatobacteraceae bacterium]
MSGEHLPSHEQQPTESPRIYVASLSDYNNGILHGTWLDAAQEPNDLWSGITQMLASSPTQARYGDVAEEWAIHDYEGFGSLQIGEYTGVERISKLARAIEEHGPAFAAWAAYVGETSDDLLEQFEDRYQGEWPNVWAYADNLLDELDAHRYLDEVPEWLQSYVTFDVAGFARDLELSGDIFTEETESGSVWVFSGH